MQLLCSSGETKEVVQETTVRAVREALESQAVLFVV